MVTSATAPRARSGTIEKPRGDWPVVPNLLDHDAARARSRWADAEREALDGLPEGDLSTLESAGVHGGGPTHG